MDLNLKISNKNTPPSSISRKGDALTRLVNRKRGSNAPNTTKQRQMIKSNKKLDSINSQAGDNNPPIKLDKIVQWNICGLNGRIPELQLITKEHSPKIFALQETLFNKRKYYDRLDKSKYDWYFRNGLNKSRGGVAIAIDKAIPHNQIPITSQLQAVACRTIGKNATTYASIYVPPNKYKTPMFKRELIKLIKQLPEPFILMGDINAHSIEWGSFKTNSYGTAVQEIVDELNLQILNDGSFTKTSHNSIRLSAIDMSITSQGLTELKWEVEKDCRGSDHFPIIITEGIQSNELKSKPTWDHRNADWKKFQSTLISTITDDNSNTLESITEGIRNAAYASIPRSNRNTRKTVPWWNAKVAKCIKKRRTALRRFKKHTPNDKKKIFLHRRLKRANHKAEAAIKKAKKESWENFLKSLNEDITDTKEIWNKINALSGKYKKNKIILSDGRNVIDNPKELANKLADQFYNHSATKNYTQTFQSLKRRRESKMLFPQYISNKVFNRPFSLEELNNALDNADGKATGIDDISYDMLRHLPVETKITLLETCNKEWKAGNLPTDSWKTGIVIPIPKDESNPHDINNYRPITLLSCLGKIVDRMVSTRLITTLEEDGRIDPNQFAFRLGLGTDAYQTELEGTLRNAIKLGKHVECAFLDISKAYDKAWRRPILEQLIKWEIDGNMYKYIENFLTNRKFQVEIGTERSEPKIQENGMPQGAVLSVILFLVAMHSITRKYRKSKKTVKILVYADDIAIIVIGRLKKPLRARLQRIVDRVSTWARRRGFKIAPHKSKMIHICHQTRHNRYLPKIIIDDEPIEEVNCAKLLGIIIDKRLNFRKHMIDLKANLKNRCNMMKAIGGRYKGGNRKTMLRVFNSLVLSKILYGAHFYSGGNELYWSKVYPEYNQTIRKITGALRTSRVSSILAETGALPLETHIKQTTITKAITWLETHDREQETGQPLLERANNFAMELINEDLPMIARRQDRIGTKWYETKVKIDWSIKKSIKAGEQHDKALQVFLETYNKYPDHYKIYTDGSVKDDNVGCGISSNDNDISLKLNKMCTIFSAECKGLLEAIKTVAKSDKPNIIFTDSAGCLEALKKGTSRHPWVEDVHREATKKDITLCWVPGHVGITGNEKADKLAEIGRDTGFYHPEVPASDATKWFQQRIRWAHDAKWRREDTSFLRQTKPTTLPWKDRNDIAMQRRLTRLRIGHTWGSHGYILHKEDQPMCKYCNVPFTHDHMIRFCPAYDESRNRHNITGLSTYNNEKENEENLIEFLKENDEFNNI